MCLIIELQITIYWWFNYEIRIIEELFSIESAIILVHFSALNVDPDNLDYRWKSTSYFNEIYVKIISKNIENSHPSFRRRVRPCLKRGWEIDKYMISNIMYINQDIMQLTSI